MKKNAQPHKNAEPSASTDTADFASLGDWLKIPSPSAITPELDSTGGVKLTLLGREVTCQLRMTPAQTREMADTLLTLANACEAAQRAREARGE